MCGHDQITGLSGRQVTHNRGFEVNFAQHLLDFNTLGTISRPAFERVLANMTATQAHGDFQVLLDRERRALRMHLTGDVESGLEKLAAII